MMTRKIGRVFAAVCAAGLMFTGCGNGGTDSESTPTPAGNGGSQAESTPTEAPKELSGTISLAGSTSMEKVATALQEAFMEANQKVTVQVEFSGSGAGIESLIAGSVDIGNSSRSLKDSEKEQGAVENVVAIDGIAVIVDKANTLTNLTKEQLVSIYTGQVTNWSELGGADQPIVVIGREAGSGTRGAFEELLEIADMCAYASELSSTGAVMAKVGTTPGAIGYVSLDVVDDSVTAVSFEGVAPTVENIKAGEYALSRPFVMATMGEISEQSELVQAWFAFIASDEGKSIIQSVGLIVND